jgi:nicotinate-nucleotide adenylyltransferase
MKIGLYFGSFNPVHVGHLIIANHILNETDIDKVWFILSPQNPFKHNHSLLNEYDRLHLLRTATEDDPRIRVSDIEFNLPKPSYTSVTLAHLAEKYPDQEFVLIMGSDSFQNLPKWKNAEWIMKHYPVYVYMRPGFEVQTTQKAQWHPVQAPLLEISATHIRQLVQDGKSIRYLVPESVREEIEKAGFYRQKTKKD